MYSCLADRVIGHLCQTSHLRFLEEDDGLSTLSASVCQSGKLPNGHVLLSEGDDGQAHERRLRGAAEL